MINPNQESEVRNGRVRLWSQIRGLIPEVSKFGTVGVVAFLIHNAVFLLVNGPLGWGATVAKALAVAIATVFSYFGNRSWTFSKRKSNTVAGEGLKFLAVNVFGFGVEWLPLGISHYLLGIQTPFADWFSAVIIGTALGTVFRFLAYRKWVFVATTKN